jgi:hypothetical protein
MRRSSWLMIATVGLALTWPADGAGADAVISNGTVSLGVFDFGSLGAKDSVNQGIPRTGIKLAGVGDALIKDLPGGGNGNTSEGWGVSVTESPFGIDFVGNGFSKSGVPPIVSTSNLNLVSPLQVNGNSATSTAALISLFNGQASRSAGLTITQLYRPTSTPFLFEDLVTIKNTNSVGSGISYTGVKYRRVVDVDVPPTPFSEYITIQGLPATRVLHSSDNGFATAEPNPLPQNDIGSVLPGTYDKNVVNSGPPNGGGAIVDHGAAIDLLFPGSLDPTDSLSFSLYFGGAYDRAQAVNALASQQAEVYFLGTAGTPDGATFGRPGTFILGLKGVGGTPVSPVADFVPEPGIYAMLAGMFAFGAGIFVRGRR